MAAFDQANTTGAPVYVPALGRMVQTDEVVTFDALIAGFTPIPSPSDDVPAAAAQLAQDVAAAPVAPEIAPEISTPPAAPATTTTAKKSAAATPKKED